MDKKIQDYYQKNRLRVEELIKKIVKIDQVEEIDFKEDIIMINRVENSSFLVKDKKISILSALLKKIFQIMEKDKYLFYEYKYDLLNCLTDILKAFQALEKKSGPEEALHTKEYIKLDRYIDFFDEAVNKANENKRYYYIKMKLDKTRPLFFLTRNIFLDFLKQYGNPYNYTPQDTSNEEYDYFVLDFKLNKDAGDFDKIIKEYNDEAVKEIKVLNIDELESVYNIKFYFKENRNELPSEITENFKVLESVCYYNLIDCYVLENDEVRISDILFNKKFGDLELVTFKRFNERETRILILLNMKKENLSKIKARIGEIISDKEVKDILYRGKHDFYGLQLLEYLKENYNIEYGGY
jgi:hypothetical protein